MMTHFTQLAKRSLSKSQQSGFTLTELMISAFITVTVVGAGGWAIATMVTSSKTNSSQNERRVELNRSLDFMSAEARQAVNINVGTAPAAFAPSATEVITSSVESVLRLKVDGLTAPVIYYTATPATSNTTWRGPKVIYRWGPSFSSAGVYGSDKATPTTWTHQPLIDAIESTASTVSCPTGWTASPSTGATGFYACIDSNKKIAQIYNKGRITKVLGQTAPYLASTQAFARSAASSTPTFSISGGSFILGVDSDITVKILGSDIRCGTSGTPVKTGAIVNIVSGGSSVASAPVIVDPASAMPADLTYTGKAAGTSVNFTGYVLPKVAVPPEIQTNLNNTCNLDTPAGSGFNSVANPSQVRILKHGDLVPTVAGWGGASVSSFIDAYIDDSVSPARVSLPYPDRQSIILYELWSNDTTAGTFDLQDMVLLVTADPT
jgi:type II secretory pathway component PulJ